MGSYGGTWPDRRHRCQPRFGPRRTAQARRSRRSKGGVAGQLTNGTGDSHAVVGHPEGGRSAEGEVAGPTVVDPAADVGMSGYGCSLAQARYPCSMTGKVGNIISGPMSSTRFARSSAIRKSFFT